MKSTARRATWAETWQRLPISEAWRDRLELADSGENRLGVGPAHHNLHDEMNFGPAAGQVGENVTNSSEVCTLFVYTCTGCNHNHD